MQMKKPVVAITMGDPCGIGPEIIACALHSNEVNNCCTPIVLGDRYAMGRAIELVGSNQKLVTTPFDKILPSASTDTVFLSEISFLTNSDTVYGSPTNVSGDAVFRYITAGSELCMSRRVSAMATAPINKAAMNLAGHNYPGHTELLAELTGSKEFVMMLAGENLRVALVTIHEAVADVPSLVTYEKVLATIMTTNHDVARYFCQNPRIATESSCR